MYEDDRGAYTPPTREPLSFDARPVRQRRPAPMTLVASGVVLIVLVAAVVVFYRSGVRGANEPPRAVGHSIAQIKSPAVENAKPVDDGALDVYVTDKNTATSQPTFTAPPEQPQARPGAPPVQAQTAPPPAPVQVATAEPAPAASAEQKAAAVKVATAKTPPAKPALKPLQLAQAVKPAPKADAAEAPAAKGGAMVQIGAFASSSIADSEFAKVKGAFAKFTSGHGKHVEPVERNGSTLYRTAFTGFSKEDARAFCSALKAAGRACIVK